MLNFKKLPKLNFSSAYVPICLITFKRLELNDATHGHQTLPQLQASTIIVA